MQNKLQEIMDGDIVINDIEYENTFSDDVSIDKTDLESEFLSHPSKFAYYAGLYELAQTRADKLKFELEVLYAQLDFKVRQNAAAVNASRSKDDKIKYTEAMVENEVKTSEAYQKKYNDYLEACKTAGLLNRAREAFMQRKDCLIQLAHNSRVGAYEPRVIDQTAAGVRSRMSKDSE